ncbi:hypothetical protein [Mesorhizobium sp.]|uniref:hypothetical protein n=1 Tax=Mesorhizobium sp. TaxID=1871066 RepID=UPI000FE8CC22|nr:hypothetical protein [Mesorhizobium sp.]RWD23043.1 MAG: hypothetical protein EOS33_27170 [Mesorhizobium sp.]
MERLLGLSQKRAKELAPGELFLFAHRSSDEPTSLAILLENNPQGEPVYGVIASPDFGTPICWHVGDETDYCLSYGSNWLLEERPTVGVALAEEADQNIRVFIDKEAVVLKFLPPQGLSHRALLFDVVAAKFHQQLGSRAARLSRWAIWASRDQFDSHRGSPLFEFAPAKTRS